MSTLLPGCTNSATRGARPQPIASSDPVPVSSTSLSPSCPTARGGRAMIDVPREQHGSRIADPERLEVPEQRLELVRRCRRCRPRDRRASRARDPPRVACDRATSLKRAGELADLVARDRHARRGAVAAVPQQQIPGTPERAVQIELRRSIAPILCPDRRRARSASSAARTPRRVAMRRCRSRRDASPRRRARCRTSSSRSSCSTLSRACSSVARSSSCRC